ncbi:MAG: hypothetical protein K0U52_10805 [Gammaproteobacteria bacterium]|nr:hypothetical protein [Gammaproteobacteria bacterium]
MTTFKDFEQNRNLPEQGNAFGIFEIPNKGGVEWQNGDMTLKLKDYDDFARGTTSGSLKIAPNVGWTIVVKLETQNGGYLSGNIFQDSITSMSEYIVQSDSVDHSGVASGDSVLITLSYGSYMEIDIDATSGNGIHRFRLNLADRQITSSDEINDEAWVELISASFMGEVVVGDGSQGADPVQGGGFTDIDPEVATYWEEGENFSTMEFYKKSDIDFPDSQKIVLNNNDIPFTQSAGILLQVAQDRYVDIKIKTENRDYFNDIKALLSIDGNARDLDLESGDPSFTYRLFGGSTMGIDIDDEHGLGAGFSLNTFNQSYTVGEFADNEWILTIVGFGDYTRLEDGDDVVLPPTDPTDPTTVVVEGDPFGLFDSYDQIIDDEDGLLDRLTAAFSFGIRTSFRAVEAVVEGAFIALPAIIVIVSSLLLAKVIISLTESGAESLIEDIGAVV